MAPEKFMVRWASRILFQISAIDPIDPIDPKFQTKL